MAGPERPAPAGSDRSQQLEPSQEAAGSGGWARTTQAAYQAHEQLAPLRAEQAWQHSTGAGVTVAVLDSGVDADHPDLAGRVRAGEDFVDDTTDGRADPVGHGTTVASLIAGRGDGPVIGLAPDATILPVRVLDEQNRYQSAATVAEAVVWAVRHDAQVINLSLGGSRESEALSDALELAMANDVVVVACTGNLTDDPDEQVWYPAREPGVVAVAGVTGSAETTVRWRKSITGPETVLAAPAVMLGAEAGGGHREVQGTSFSAALVSATAALVRARWPELSAGDVVNRLVATADDLGPPGRNRASGFGAVDPAAAVTAHVPLVRANPLDTKPGHPTGFGAARHREHPLSAPLSPFDPHGPQGGQPAGEAVAPRTSAHRSGIPPELVGGMLGGLVALAAVAAAVRGLRRRSGGRRSAVPAPPPVDGAGPA